MRSKKMRLFFSIRFRNNYIFYALKETSTKAYFKDSFLNALGITTHIYNYAAPIFVDKNYNIFGN